MEEKAKLIELKLGNNKAFDSLYNSYHKKLFAFTYKFLNNWHDSEDLVQKIFVIIWEKRKQIDPDKSFNNYLFTIARNEIYDLLKKRAITGYYEDYINNIVAQNDGEIEKKKLIEIMYALIDKIPERRRQIFLLNRDNGLTYKQIGQRLGISENTVDTQIRNVLNYLRKELPNYLKILILLIISHFS